MTDCSPPLEWDGLRVHFVGIGGIGMSALARIAAARGAVVSGCDAEESPTLAELRSRGWTCQTGHSPAHLDGAEVVAYSSAVPLSNPELQAARSRGIRLVSRGRMLAWLQQGHEAIAVAGTHGKTSTTWILSHVLIRCGADPTVAVGGLVSDLHGTNCRIGGGRLLVAEADESDGSFLHLVPKYPVITNIDEDHLDYYSDLREIEAAFLQFAGGSSGGAVIACADCPRVRRLLRKLRRRILTYGLREGDVRARNVRTYPHRVVYDAVLPTGTIQDVVVSLPGVHNAQNSLAALALADELELDIEVVLEALADLRPVDRRLQRRGAAQGIAVYDDYAHHPTEVAATLAAARTLARGRLVGVFQPHRYSRTLHLHREFGPVFDALDLLLVAPIYAASEAPIEGVTADLIADQVRKHGKVPCELVPALEEVPERLLAELAPGDTVITLGAGNVWQAGEALLEKMRGAEAA